MKIILPVAMIFLVFDVFSVCDVQKLPKSVDRDDIRYLYATKEQYDSFQGVVCDKSCNNLSLPTLFSSINGGKGTYVAKCFLDYDGGFWKYKKITQVFIVEDILKMNSFIKANDCREVCLSMSGKIESYMNGLNSAAKKRWDYDEGYVYSDKKGKLFMTFEQSNFYKKYGKKSEYYNVLYKCYQGCKSKLATVR